LSVASGLLKQTYESIFGILKQVRWFWIKHKYYLAGALIVVPTENAKSSFLRGHKDGREPFGYVDILYCRFP
jgi:hypothetical protein